MSLCAPSSDAKRNSKAILEAAITCLVRDPAATVADIAREAGDPLRHYKSREELLDAVFVRVSARATDLLDSVDASPGGPLATLEPLVRPNWRIVDQHRAVLTAAPRELSPERIRDLHDRLLERLAQVLTAGQESGVMRADLSTAWLSASVTALMHTAAAEVAAGRLTERAAGHAVLESVLALCRTP